ncbi:choice-of-anchor L domain-containing protein [bacterium]|nr:choice-of-anchor L domain-containing protein [bacterium]
MKYVSFFLSLLILFLFSCSNNSNPHQAIACTTTDDCPLGQLCNTSDGFCYDPTAVLDKDTAESDDSDTTHIPADSDNIGEVPDGMTCNPGSTQKCPYGDDTETEDVGPCKAALRKCLPDGEWDVCRGAVYPTEDICSDGIDNDCDGKTDNGSDRDGDGFGICEGDCCDLKADCSHPEKVYPGADEIPNGEDDNCNDEIDEGVYDCEGSSTAPFSGMDLAKAIGLCHEAQEGDVWGVISAEILLPDGTTGVDPRAYNILPTFGSIGATSGSTMLVFSSGEATSPIPKEHIEQGTAARAPNDWLSKNNNMIPNAPACVGSSPTPKPTVFDPVMLKLVIKVPPLVKSFSFDTFFFSREFPGYVCGYYNDFFVALLDSKHTSEDPSLQNPYDKNLAVDSEGNPLGVNLAKAGLFSVCAPQTSYPSCSGDTLLNGTGFEGRGATGWLTTRGNVIPEETITLRFAMWDSGDHILDSLVLIDNFTWYPTEYVPGTSD